VPRADRGAKHTGTRGAADSPQPLATQVQDALSWLEKKSTRRDRENLARFGITAPRAFGVSMANIQALAKQLGRSHDLATALWQSGWYEARLLTAFVDEPARVTPRQMDRWCREFDNWGICDTVCFHLFDRTPFAWAKVHAWHDRGDEFVKRAAFALLASLALHDRSRGDAAFLEGLELIERAATDERNFVKKGVSWALRLIGRRNAALNAAAIAVSRRLSDSDNAAARWIGKGAVKELTGPVVKRQLAARSASARRTQSSRRPPR
jgi:3-methyladenine DNA glycosylase AlkD